MISVIIPTFNRCSFLERAIASVMNQTASCGELLIIDDGSTDETETMVSRLAGESPVPLRYYYQENKGAAGARNLGIRNAQGDFICFLDSDDLFVPEKIALQKHALEKSGCLVSHTGEKWLRRGKHLNQKKKHSPPDGNIFRQCLPMCVVGMSTVMVRPEIFDKYGMFDETLPCCEDYDLWLRISRTEKFKLVPDALTIKNGGREDQLSVIHRVGIDRYRILSLEKLLLSNDLAEDQYMLALEELQRKCRIYGKGCLKHGREKEGNHYINLPVKFSRSRLLPNSLTPEK